MKTLNGIWIVGDIERVERKSDVGRNKDKVAEFYVEGCGLRITAWGDKADQVPDAGTVAVSGYLNTRTYEYEGKDRTSTDIRANVVQAITAEDDDPDGPF